MNMGCPLVVQKENDGRDGLIPPCRLPTRDEHWTALGVKPRPVGDGDRHRHDTPVAPAGGYYVTGDNLKPKSMAMSKHGEIVTLESGLESRTSVQEMWAGMKIVSQKGAATLHFDGACRNNPNGPAGYGFHIKRDDNADELIRGYGYAGMNRTGNEVEYMGLLEGLIWATRLDLKRLTIKDDSELIIRQMKGEYQVRESRLQAFYAQVLALVQRGVEANLVCNFIHIPRDKNTIADCLANLGIDTRENVVACNWAHVNKLMSRKRN